MKLVAVIILALTQTACAVISAANITSYWATEQTLTDHAMTLAVPNSTCSSLQLIRGQYYCEIRDVSKTYNRNPL